MTIEWVYCCSEDRKMTLKKTLMVYLASYFLLFVLVCAMLLPVTSRTTALARERVMAEKLRQAELCLDELTGQTDKFMQIASAMSVNQDVIMASISKDDVASTVNTIRVKKQLQYYGGMMDHVEACLLVLPSNRTVISREFISRDFMQAYGVCFSFNGMSAEEAWALVNTTHRSVVCIPLDRAGLIGYDINEPCLLFLSWGTFDVNNTSICTAAFVIRTQNFLSRTLDMVGEDSLILLTDESGKVLCSLGEGAEAMHSSSTGDMIDAPSGRYVTISSRSSHMGMELVLGIPETSIYQNTLQLTDFVPVYLGFGLLSVAVLCVVYAIVHYRRISHLVVLGERISDLPYEKAGSYTYLQQVMNHVSDQNKEYFFKYTQTDHAYLNSMLLNACIHGVYLADQIKALEKYIGSLTGFVMAAMQYSPQAGEEAILKAESRLREVFSQEQVISIHPKPQTALVIISTESDFTGLKERLLQELTDICRQGSVLRAGISDTLSGVEMIQEGYQQTQLMLQRLETGVISGIADTYKPDENEGSPINIATLNRLNDLVLYGKNEEVESFFDEIECMLASGSVGGEQFTEMCYSMQMVLSCLAAELAVTFDKAAEASYPSASLKRLRLRAAQLASQVRQRQQTGNEQLCRQAVETMEQMMSDPALNASMLAEKLGVSEKYVYRIVKDWSGRSFGSFLEEMRIKKAEELLLTTPMSNEQIAEAVGFASLTTFYRAFRKRHSMPPAAWRNGARGVRDSKSASED